MMSFFGVFRCVICVIISLSGFVFVIMMMLLSCMLLWFIVWIVYDSGLMIVVFLSDMLSGILWMIVVGGMCMYLVILLLVILC